MVVATKFQLKEPISQKDGTWNTKGRKENLGTKIVKRSYVEDRNSHHNNEIYIIDEAATDKMVEDRQRNIDSRNGVNTTVKMNGPVTTTHVLTEEDVKNNPDLKENGLSAGDEVQLDAEGNVLIQSQ